MKDIAVPKYVKGKKPMKIRRPSQPLDGINHRLLREAAAKEQATDADQKPVEQKRRGRPPKGEK